MKIPKNFFTRIFAAVLLLFIFAVSPLAQTAPPNAAEDSKMIIDCQNNDMKCFIRATEKCQRATLTNYVSQTFFDQEFSQTTFYEIKGGRGNRCELYLKVLDWQVKTVELSEAEKEKIIRQMVGSGTTVREMTEEEKKQVAEREQSMKKRMSDVIGTDGTCTFKAANLAAAFERWNSGKFSSEDYKGANCRGTYFTPENGFYNYAK